ncbi:MAG: amino acid ABC transporter substrate-binding protein [Firmicutes bacterium]|nr:amino acid ABC transporter substrate-binding protein [Bacillota bacterium]
MMKKLVSMLLIMVLCVSAFVGCGSEPVDEGGNNEVDQSGKPMAGQELTVAMSANYKYFETVEVDEKGNEKYVGLDIDILDKLSEKLGFTYTISNMPFASLIGSLQGGQADFVISGMSANEERAKSVDFSIGYATAKVGCLIKADSDITSVKDLNGHAVACSAGTNYENIVKSIDGAELKTFDGQAAVTQELVVGRVSAAITGATACKKICEENADLDYFVLTAEDVNLNEYSTYNIAFPKGSELVAIFDEALTEMKEDGTIDAILTEWLGADYVD